MMRVMHTTWVQPAAVLILGSTSVVAFSNGSIEVLDCQTRPGAVRVSYVNRTRSTKGAMNFLVVRDAVVQEVTMLGRFAPFVVQQTDIATAGA